ncbi:hypothetical protein AB2N08_16220 [Massilia aurea]|uniref:hypothetical protein n=1 Tax=Massilia aurea TaxID=373040 RepID=UPI0034630413
MPHFKLKLAMVAGTATLFLAAIFLNEMLFTRLEFAPGINPVYLPAGVRLLSVLLFAEAGAVGLLLASWLICFFYFFPNDPLRSFIGGILASLAPYLAYRVLLLSGVGASLRGMSGQRLFCFALLFSIMSPAMHHIWFALMGHEDLWHGFLVMAIGDLAGTLIVLYGARSALNILWPAGVSRR